MSRNSKHQAKTSRKPVSSSAPSSKKKKGGNNSSKTEPEAEDMDDDMGDEESEEDADCSAHPNCLRPTGKQVRMPRILSDLQNRHRIIIFYFISSVPFSR